MDEQDEFVKYVAGGIFRYGHAQRSSDVILWFAASGAFCIGSSVWKVIHEGQIIAFFTVSMNSVGLEIIPQESRVKEMGGRYPAMLLGQMWVGPSFRGRQVAYWICQYVMGLARKIKPKVACSCVILQTDDDERKIKPYTKARFVRSKTSNGKIWMHRSTA